MEGKVKLVGSRIDTDFIIDVADVGPAYRHVQKTPIELNTFHEFGDREFRFSISDSREPPVIKSKEPTPDSKTGNTSCSVYAKVLLPIKLAGNGSHPVVESWIAKNLADVE